jgi:FtsP/CotA-like multicopper oxidase with cupredoxin domain
MFKRLLPVILTTSCMGMGTNGTQLPAAPTLLPTPIVMGCPQPTQAVNLTTQPKVVEVDLTAAPAQHEWLAGKPTEVWAYNGEVPGPTLRAKVGDTLRVHFHNQLPETTSVHWHGLRVPLAMDGMASEVAPGQSFTFEFKLLDVGTFWYHPHTNTAVQVDRGLYGAIVVEDDQPPVLGQVADEVLVLDDVLVQANSGMMDTTAHDMRMDVMGSEGNVLLVNGAQATREIAVKAGEPRLWRLVNAANSRYFSLQLDGGTMIRVGGDRGWLTAPETVQTLLLVPGERAEVLVTAGATTTTLRVLPFERMMGAGSSGGADLVRLQPSLGTAATPPLPDTLRPFTPPGASILTRDVVFDETMNGMHDMTSMMSQGGMGNMGGTNGMMMQFTINGASYPNVPVLHAHLGSVETWNVRNDSVMAHPLHLHGFAFAVHGQSEWKDTVNIPAGQTVQLDVLFDDRQAARGMWMYHCHILEHADGGMIGMVDVE